MVLPMNVRDAIKLVGAQQAGLDTNSGQQPGFAAGPPTTSLCASAAPGVLRKISGPLAGCNNMPRPAPDATYLAQAGWITYTDSNGRAGRIPALVEIKASFGTTACQNDRSATEACCASCRYRRPAGAPP